MPVTAHPAFNKACAYFDIETIIVPVTKDFQADIKKMKNAINKNTVMIVGSAP